jgi:hypothetical protein
MKQRRTQLTSNARVQQGPSSPNRIQYAPETGSVTVSIGEFPGGKRVVIYDAAAHELPLSDRAHIGEPSRAFPAT